MVHVQYEPLDIPDDVMAALPAKLPEYLLAGPGKNTIRVSTPFGNATRIRHVVIWAVHYLGEPPERIPLTRATPEVAVVVSMKVELEKDDDRQSAYTTP